jgi:hypothetical protein
LNNPTTRQKKTFHCPRNLVKNERGQDQWKGECIICTFLADLWQRSDKTTGKEQEDLRNQYRQMKAVERYYYNVIVRSEKDKDGIVKSNVGPKIYSCGKTVHAKIVRAMLGDKTAGEKPLGDICHPTTGRDFRVVKKVVKGGGGEEYPNYDNSKFEDESPAGSIDQLGKWVENLHDLHALRAIKTQDELRHALKVHLGVIKEVRPLGMARHLHLLPRRQAGIGIRHHLARAGAQTFHFTVDVEIGVGLRERLQLGDLAFQLGDGAFKVQILHAGSRFGRNVRQKSVLAQCLRNITITMA